MVEELVWLFSLASGRIPPVDCSCDNRTLHAGAGAQYLLEHLSWDGELRHLEDDTTTRNGAARNRDRHEFTDCSLIRHEEPKDTIELIGALAAPAGICRTRTASLSKLNPCARNNVGSVSGMMFLKNSPAVILAPAREAALAKRHAPMRSTTQALGTRQRSRRTTAYAVARAPQSYPRDMT